MKLQIMFYVKFMLWSLLFSNQYKLKMKIQKLSKLLLKSFTNYFQYLLKKNLSITTHAVIGRTLYQIVDVYI
uniref:Putative secreted protein n=1 Tax=Xenopsylla cheopis TaxID=163159 RepID=A0A6M2DZ63_XENCH